MKDPLLSARRLCVRHQKPQNTFSLYHHAKFLGRKNSDNDNDDNDTHSSKVFQQWSEAWPCGRGHNPAKKNLMRMVRLALIASCVTGTLFTTVCSHINREGKGNKECGKLVIQAVAETNSNEFK